VGYPRRLAWSFQQHDRRAGPAWWRSGQRTAGSAGRVLRAGGLNAAVVVAAVRQHLIGSRRAGERSHWMHLYNPFATRGRQQKGLMVTALSGVDVGAVGPQGQALSRAVHVLMGWADPSRVRTMPRHLTAQAPADPAWD